MTSCCENLICVQQFIWIHVSEPNALWCCVGNSAQACMCSNVAPSKSRKIGDVRGFTPITVCIICKFVTAACSKTAGSNRTMLQNNHTFYISVNQCYQKSHRLDKCASCVHWPQLIITLTELRDVRMSHFSDLPAEFINACTFDLWRVMDD